MIPAPALTGSVFGPHGNPLPAALVRAYSREYTPYGTQLTIVKTGMTDDRGEFRLFGLNFGQYFVSAGYGDRDRAAAIGGAKLSTNVSKADDGYATLFYGGAQDISRAQAARLAPGSYPGTLNIYLRDSARLKVRGQTLPPVGGTQVVLAPKRQRSHRGRRLHTTGHERCIRNSWSFARRLSPARDGSRWRSVLRRDCTQRDE